MRKLISSNPNEFSVPELLIISFLLTLFMTGIFAFPGFAFPTSNVLSHTYYRIRKPKVLKQIYKTLGMKYFRVLLLILFWGRKSNQLKFFNGTKRGLDNFIHQTKQSEFGHLGAFLLITISSVILLVYGYLFLVAMITFINVFGNLYPIVLQRYHRLRIEKINIR
jgi:hypothetical protein